MSKVSSNRGRAKGLPLTFGRARFQVLAGGSDRGVNAGELVGDADIRPS